MSTEFIKEKINKLDKQELNEWIDSLDSVIQNHGREAAKEILETLEKRAKELRELSKTIMFNLQQRLISQKIEVLIEKDGYGKSSQYFDVILSSNHNLNLQVGDIVQCRVNDVKGLKLSATPLFNC